MQNRLNVLCYLDSPTTSTGFAQVSRNILKHLYATGKYNFTCIGINHDGSPYDQQKYPYAIYPATSPLAMNEVYKDVYGRQKFIDFARSGQFDLVFMLNDTFIIETFLPTLLETRNNLPKEKKFPIIMYFPIDGTPKKSWIENVVAKVDFPVTYTEYAKRECLKHVPGLQDMPVIYHGVDKETFYPLPADVTAKFRKEFFGANADKYIVLNVNRNQPRKDLHRTFAAFKLFHEKHPNTFLFINAQKNDVGGNLAEIAEHYGLVFDKDWACPGESFNANQGFPIHVVNMLYNACDVVVSSAIGEGWGLCLHPDTKLYTDSGIKMLSQLSIMDKVLSSDGTYNDVEHIMSRMYDDDLFMITSWLSNIPIKASGEHGFKVLSDSGECTWKRAKELHIGDNLVFPRNYMENNVQKLDVLELVKPVLNIRQIKNIVVDGDHFKIQSNFKKEERCIPRYITIDTDFCKMYGLYLAEGCAPSSKKDSISFAFNKNEVKEMDFVIDYMKRVFGIDVYYMPDNRENYNGQLIVFYSSVLATLFSVLAGEGARNKKIHPLLLNLDKECLGEILHGLFIGDGSFSNTTYEFSFSTTSMNIAYAIRLLLARLGIASSVRTSRVEYKVNVSGKSKDRILDIFKMSYPEVDRNRATERTFMTDDYIVMPIKDIKRSHYTGKLLDIQVANTNDFVAENVIVHNSSVESMATKTPVLFPNNTSFPEIIGENEEYGHTCKSGETINDYICLGAPDNNLLRPVVNVFDMADKMQYIYEHQDEAKAKAEKAYERVWTWEMVCEQWKEIFHKAEVKRDIMRQDLKIGRNEQCKCGSGKKYKDCCGR